MAQTAVEKITQAHLVEGPKRPLRSGDYVTIRPHHVMTHDNTAAVMKKFRGLGATASHDPRQPVFTLDHDIQNRSQANLDKYSAVEAFAAELGIDFHPAGMGIGHQVMVERGYVEPGSFVVASDSHSNMYGALGAIGTPVVRTDAAAIWATGEFWWQIPRTVQVVLCGSLRPGVTGKDIILTLCGLYHDGEVLNAAVEFAGPGAATLTIDDRFTISNMTTEWGALVGWFPVDDVTLSYLRSRRAALGDALGSRLSDQDIQRWEADPPRPDTDATYAARIQLDLDSVTPHVTGPDTVHTMTPLAEMAGRRVAIHKAYIVSCVNSRLSDLESAAAVLDGKAVADGVELYVAAASREVQEAAQESGAWQTLANAGAQFLPPGCGPCIGLGAGLLEPGQVGISATNRNFKGRMGSRDAQCYLASPLVVAASAAAGIICGPDDHTRTTSERHHEDLPSHGADSTEPVEILDGFPARLSGRLVHLPADNLNTDGIYGKDYTYREDMSPDDMARVVMENYDPAFASEAKPGDILVSGWNFGTGSSREQAVTALQAAGVAMVIAGSFSQTYLRNAFNNGFLCIECPDLVAQLRLDHAQGITAGKRTIISDQPLEIDFAASLATWKDEAVRFTPMGTVPQSLVVAGGIENLVRNKL